jgi:cation diffusion facilitator family transporter
MKASHDVRPLQTALAAYVIVLALKLVVYFMTGVMALLAEALHTLSDIFITGFLLAAAVWSRRAADRTYMFGYGRAQNAAALVAATMFISFTAYKLYEEAIPRLFRPAEASYQNLWLAATVVVLSMLVAAVPLIQLYRQKQRGAAARAQYLESINDELGLLAALAGTLFIGWGLPLADPIATLVVATIIAVNGFKLLRENFSLLVGRSPGPEFLAQLERLARSVPGVLGVHDLRAEYTGPETVHADLHVDVQPGLPIEQAHRIAVEVTRRVHQEIEPGYCVVHVDPAGRVEAPEAARSARAPAEPSLTA